MDHYFTLFHRNFLLIFIYYLAFWYKACQSRTCFLVINSKAYWWFFVFLFFCGLIGKYDYKTYNFFCFCFCFSSILQFSPFTKVVNSTRRAPPDHGILPPFLSRLYSTEALAKKEASKYIHLNFIHLGLLLSLSFGVQGKIEKTKNLLKQT